MKLNSEKNLLIYQKSLFVEQLYNYSKLCELYSNLAGLHSSLRTAEEIAEYYSRPLSLASQGKFDYIIKEDYSGKELAIFKRYEHFSQCFNDFQKASYELGAVLNNDNNTVDSNYNMHQKGNSSAEKAKEIEKIRGELLSSPTEEVRKFQQDIDDSTPNSIAYRTSVKARKSGNKILLVDRNAVSPNLRKVDSKSFGATISKEATIRKNKQRGNHKYTSKGISKNRLLALAAVLALTITGVSHSISSNLGYSNLSATDNTKNGYQVLVSQDTQSSLSAIGYTISFFKSHPEVVPSSDNISEIRQSLDLVYDDIMSDLVTKAFEESNSGSTVTSVETTYDKTTNQYLSSDAAEPHPEHFCIITYTDENGEHQKTVMKFDSEIDESFEHEYDLDTKALTLDDLEKIYNHANHLAGTEFSYSSSILGGANLKSKTPPEEPER